MATWTPGELNRIANADEAQISFVRSDGTLSRPRTVWVVRLGDDLYVRSVNGRDAAWFRGTQHRHEGRIEAGGATRDVTFAEPEPGLDDALDDAYRTKYRRYPENIVNSIVSTQARAATLRLVPR
jgi:hypothetical protein